MKLKSQILIALALLALAAPVMAQSTWSSYGNQTYGTINGQQFNARRYGNQTYGRLGNQSFNTRQYGNSMYGTFGNNSLNHRQYGNLGYGRIGDNSYSTQSYGNRTYITGSGGSSTVCTRIGNQTICF